MDQQNEFNNNMNPTNPTSPLEQVAAKPQESGSKKVAVVFLFVVVLLFISFVAVGGYFLFLKGNNGNNKVKEETPPATRDTHTDNTQQTQFEQDQTDNSKNAQRTKDVTTIYSTLTAWLENEGLQTEDPYKLLGLTTKGISSLTPVDGSIEGEGIKFENLTILVEDGYLNSIFTDPDGNSYQLGVDDIVNPNHILICTDKIKLTEAFPEADYPNGLFCQSI